MKKITILLVALFLVPVFASAQPVPHWQQVDEGDNAVAEAIALRREQKALENLSEEGSAFLAKIEYFKSNAARLIKDEKLTEEKKINFVTQSLMIEVMDSLEVYDRVYDKKIEEMSGVLNLAKRAKLAVNYSIERRALLKELCKPVDGVDWFAYVTKNIDNMTHYKTVKEPIKEFVTVKLPREIK